MHSTKPARKTTGVAGDVNAAPSEKAERRNADAQQRLRAPDAAEAPTSHWIANRAHQVQSMAPLHQALGVVDLETRKHAGHTRKAGTTGSMGST
jgi:hypothetical protein